METLKERIARRKKEQLEKIPQSIYRQAISNNVERSEFNLNLSEVTACITYYRRPESLARLLQSLHDYYPTIGTEIVDTQGNLSRGRNVLTSRCQTEFYFMLEEDFEITTETNLWIALSILDADNSIAGVGGTTIDRGRDCIKWHHDYDANGEINPSEKPPRSVHGIEYQPCDLILNFGLFRTQLFRDCEWNESLPILEHREFYSRASRIAQFAYVQEFRILHHRARPSRHYREMRNRRPT